MENGITIARYVGDEFPENYGDLVEVDTNGTTDYKIRFPEENIWYDNMHDDDLEFMDESDE